jgi:hypothetical protein
MVSVAVAPAGDLSNRQQIPLSTFNDSDVSFVIDDEVADQCLHHLRGPSPEAKTATEPKRRNTTRRLEL